MRVSEKIKIYLRQNGEVLGCELDNKVFWSGLKRIKMNSCATRTARRMAKKGLIEHYYLPKFGREDGLVVYYLK
jgi:hypothetical protein